MKLEISSKYQTRTIKESGIRRKVTLLEVIPKAYPGGKVRVREEDGRTHLLNYSYFETTFIKVKEDDSKKMTNEHCTNCGKRLTEEQVKKYSTKGCGSFCNATCLADFFGEDPMGDHQGENK